VPPVPPDTIAGLLVLLAAGGALFALALFVWTVRMLTHPPRRGFGWAVAHNRPSNPGELEGEPPAFTEWTFKSLGIDLPVWDIAGSNPAGPCVILTPGWGQGRVGCLDRVSGVLGAASRVLVWDTPATGEAKGRCTLGAHEATMLADLIDRAQSERPIVLMGASMGAGVSIQVAAGRSGIADVRIAGVLAEAPYRVPFTPAKGVLTAANLPWALSLRPALAWVGIRSGAGPKWASFDRADHAANLRCPLLVLHGSDDNVCPIEDGQAIAQAASSGAIIEFEGGDHHSLWREPAWRAQCIEASEAFLVKCAQLTTGAT